MSAGPSMNRFLGGVDPAQGPFALLGIDPATCTPDAIDRALQARLERLARHPDGAGAAAEEARLALHVAAAQLRDPVVRAELVRESQASSAHSGARVASNEMRVAALSAGPGSLEDAVRWAMISAGGWNLEAMRRLGAFAGANGVDQSSLRAALAGAGGRSRARPRAAAAHSVVATPAVLEAPGEKTASNSRRPWLALLALLTLVSITLLMARALVVIEGARLRIASAPTESAAGASSSPEDFVAMPGVPLPETAAPIAPAPAKNALSLPKPAARRAMSAAPEPAPNEKPSSISEPMRQWLDAARNLTGPRIADSDPRQTLARAAQAATLSSAGALLWRGDASGAEALTRDALIPPYVSPFGDAASSPAARLTAPGAEDDGKLAQELLAARRQPGSALDVFRARRYTHAPLGPVDCDVAAETALFGSPQDLRLVGRRIVLDQRDNPAMINALIEEISRASKQPALSQLIAEVTDRKLPDVDDGAWPARARAALIERLAELLAPAEQPGVDGLAALLGAVYERQVGANTDEAKAARPLKRGPIEHNPNDPPIAREVAEFGDSRGALVAIGKVWLQLVDEGTKYRNIRAISERIGPVERLRATRLVLASGPAQRFSGEQASVCELLAVLVGEERPSAAPRIAAVISRLGAERKSAKHVFVQIEAAERALLELWMIRLEGTAEEAS